MLAPLTVIRDVRAIHLEFCLLRNTVQVFLCKDANGQSSVPSLNSAVLPIDLCFTAFSYFTRILVTYNLVATEKNHIVINLSNKQIRLFDSMKSHTRH